MTVQTKRREIGNLIIENIPEIPPSFHKQLHYYHSIRSVTFADWCPKSGGILVNTRSKESSQIHYVRKAGGKHKRLTFFDEPIQNARACPHPDHQGFLFSKDIGGNERYQIWYYDLPSGDCRLLTEGVTKTGCGVWNPAGTAFAYTSNRRNQVDQDLYLYDFETDGGDRLIMKGKGYWYPVSWSRDGRQISLIHYHSINESHLYVLDVTTGELQSICTDPEVACQGGEWSKDGKVLYFSSDRDCDCRELMTYHFESGRICRLSVSKDMEVESMAMSASGKALAYILNDHGVSRLHIYDEEQHTSRLVTGLPDGVIAHLSWHPSEPKLAMTLSGAQVPANVYVFDAISRRVEPWTSSKLSQLPTPSFVEPQLIRYETFDRVGECARSIPAFYYRSPAVSAKAPVLIYIHGGPESQFRPSFSPAFQYYVNELGLAVIAPNVRGSTGYGKHYLKLDNGYKREHAVKDIGSLLDWIGQQPELDSERVAVMGGSYGGYMVLASMALFNDRLCCGIDIFGISNFVTFLQNTKSYRRSLRRVEYGDERDPEMRQHLERISPTTNAHKITKPMMIVQGLNDPRVPVSEAEQMVRAIRENGGEAWYLLAKDEGHGFRKKSNRDFYDQATILFLKRYLLEEERKPVESAVVV